MLPERLLLYTRKINDVLKLLKNKETAASEENKFLQFRDTLIPLFQIKLKRTISSVIQLDHNNQKSWRLQEITIMCFVYYFIHAQKKK